MPKIAIYFDHFPLYCLPKHKKATTANAVAAFLFLSAAAAEDKNKSYNYEPDAVVVIKQSTQTVVHISSSLQNFKSLFALDIIL